LSYTKLIEKALEGIGFTSFEEGDDGVRRRPALEVVTGQVLKVVDPLAKNTQGVTP
jgi:hypothetical protein